MASMRRGGAGLATGLAVGLGLWVSAGTAAAQGMVGNGILPSRSSVSPIASGGYVPDGQAVGCGSGGCTGSGCPAGPCDAKTGLFGPRSGWKGPYGPFGLRVYPLFEKRYIRQFPCPTIDPNSCFGYHQTRWTQWNEACPNFVAGHPEAVYPVVQGQPAPGSVTPPTGATPPMPLPTAPAPKPLTTDPNAKPSEKGMLPGIPSIPQVPTRAPMPVRAGRS